MKQNKNDNLFSYVLDGTDTRMIIYNVQLKGKEKAIADYLKELHLDTNPYLQTIHFRYRLVIASLMYIDNSFKEVIEELHQKNLEYETINPPVIYEKTKTKKSASTSPVKRSTKSKSSSPKSTDLVLLTSLESGKTLKVQRGVAEGLIREQPKSYKYEEL